MFLPTVIPLRQVFLRMAADMENFSTKILWEIREFSCSKIERDIGVAISFTNQGLYFKFGAMEWQILCTKFLHIYLSIEYLGSLSFFQFRSIDESWNQSGKFTLEYFLRQKIWWSMIGKDVSLILYDLKSFVIWRFSNQLSEYEVGCEMAIFLFIWKRNLLYYNVRSKYSTYN